MSGWLLDGTARLRDVPLRPCCDGVPTEWAPPVARERDVTWALAGFDGDTIRALR